MRSTSRPISIRPMCISRKSTASSGQCTLSERKLEFWRNIYKGGKDENIQELDNVSGIGVENFEPDKIYQLYIDPSIAEENKEDNPNVNPIAPNPTIADEEKEEDNLNFNSIAFNHDILDKENEDNSNGHSIASLNIGVSDLDPKKQL